MASRYEKLFTRVVVAAVAIPVILWVTFAGGYTFFAFVLLISTLSLREFYDMMARKGAFPLRWMGITAGALINGAFIYERLQVDIFRFFAERGIALRMFSQLQFLLVVLLVMLLCALLVELFRTKGSPSLNLSITILGVLVISLFFGTLIGLRELFSYGFPVHKFVSGMMFASGKHLEMVNRWGGYTVVSILASIWMCDTAAYLAGSSFGRHKLFERVSPGKSWEGAAAGFLAAFATMLIAQRFFLSYLGVFDAAVIGFIVGVFGQLGDLIESRLKRDAGVKDSSAIIPGHGGVYDRFDSLVFVSPIVYLYVDFIVLS